MLMDSQVRAIFITQFFPVPILFNPNPISQNPDIQRLLEFRLVKKVTTVYEYLKERDAVNLLKHAEAVTATTAISDRGGIVIYIFLFL